MRRIRTVFLLLALVLLVPLALLVRKALVSVEAERTMQHRAVADRIIDEMERELTALLHREEDRPFAHYRYFYVPDEAAQAIRLTRSPLSEPPADDFIVGYFQIDPDGTVTTPLWPRDQGQARAAGWQPATETAAVVARVEATVGTLWTGNGIGARAAAENPRAGLTVPLRKSKRAAAVEEEALKQGLDKAQDEDSQDEDSQLSYLASLNRAVQSRAERDVKVANTQAPTVQSFAQIEEDLFGSTTDSRLMEQGATIDVRLEPMVGRPAGDDQLVLYRTVLIGEKAYRQGLVLDAPGLVAWVAERVLADSDLASRVRIVPATGAPAASAAAYSYLHRFAEPFGSVASVVLLDPLPELAGATYVYALSILLAVAATFGLLALYRMVAVVVEYAERRTNFVSAVTHELKTPLTAIRMYGEMLRDGVVPEEGKRQRYYEVMTAESERLTRLLNNVLELGRLEKKTRTMNLVTADVGPVLEEVVGVLAPHAEKEGFTLRLELASELGPVRFDRDALKQVLFNLIDNALKYSRKASEKEVVVSCRKEQEGVVLGVADRGPGVAGQHLKKIFEPFYRGESELTRTAKGTGIGLALVRGLVERMGGTVAGRNGSAGGFEVSVFLPA